MSIFKKKIKQIIVIPTTLSEEAYQAIADVTGAIVIKSPSTSEIYVIKL